MSCILYRKVGEKTPVEIGRHGMKMLISGLWGGFRAT